MVLWTGSIFYAIIIVTKNFRQGEKIMDGNNIGARIAGLRKEKGMTQAELAAVINISDKAISKWESAGSCPDIDVLIKLSDFFEVSLDYIIRGECMHQQKMFAGSPDAKITRINGLSLIDGINKYYLSRGWHVVKAEQNMSANDWWSVIIVIERNN